MKLQDYKNKKPDKKNYGLTTINLELSQLSYLRKNKINLSKLVRDILKGLIESDTQLKNK